MKFTVGTAVVGLMSLCASASFAAEKVDLLSTLSQKWVDLRDITKFDPELLPEASLIVRSMETEPDRYFPNDVQKVHGVELNTDPERQRGGTVITRPVALIDSPTQGVFFRKYEVTSRSGVIQDVRITDDIPLSKTHFKLKVGLIQRKLVLEDSDYGIKKIYPLAVGGFDEGISVESKGQIRLTTPIFESASLDQRFAIAARAEPAYYKGLPFMPITNRQGDRTTIAFHILMDDVMTRGFESHGCMRLRKKDLMELFKILMGEANDSMPVQVLYQIQDAADSPYPLAEIGYVRFKNFGTLEHPESRRDNVHHLVIMERDRIDPPPYRLIPGLNLDALFLEQATADLQ